MPSPWGVLAAALCALGAARGEGIYQKTRSAVPWRTLTAEQAARLDGGEWASLTAATAALIPEAVFTAMVADDFAKLQQACAGLTLAQLAALPAAAWANTAPLCLQSLNSTQFAALSAAQLGFLPAQIARFVSREQIAALRPATCGALSANLLVKELSVSACDGFTPPCAAFFTVGTLAALTPTCVSVLSLEAVSALPADRLGRSGALASFLPDQAGALVPRQCRLLSGAQVTALAGGCSGLTPGCVRAMRVRELPWIGAACLQEVGVDVLVDLSSSGRVKYFGSGVAGLVKGDWARLEALGPAYCESLPHNDAQDLRPALCRQLSPRCVAAATADFVAGLSDECVAALPPAAFRALPPWQLPLVSQTAFAMLTPVLVSALTPAQCGALTDGQIAQIPRSTGLCAEGIVQCVAAGGNGREAAYREMCGQERAM